MEKWFFCRLSSADKKIVAEQEFIKKPDTLLDVVTFLTMYLRFLWPYADVHIYVGT
jgi:hypothetical protein